MLKIFLPLICSFVTTMLIAKPTILLTRKLHAEQSILEYVDNHQGKQGTPTMGGIMFLVPISIIAIVFGGVHSKVMLVMLGSMLSFGLLGFLDDFIKVKFKHNEGLKAYQKIIGQLGIGIIVTLFAYNHEEIQGLINVQFTDKTIDMSYFYIPFTLFVFLATTNAVNLTDGIDGLATSTTIVYLTIFLIILILGRQKIEGDIIAVNTNNAEIVLLSSTIGGLLAFLWHNSNKASIFMGDTGSLALGGIVASIGVFTKNTLLIPIIGIMYMVSCISVIMQVCYFKLTRGKRIFLMAPYHHHLQYKGMTENKIVVIYSIITLLGGLVALVSIK